jgi:putative transposase
MKKTLDSIIDIPPVDLPNDWAEFVDQPLTEKELESIRYSVNRQVPFGSKRWKKKISKELGLEKTLKPKGRPKGEKSEEGKNRCQVHI